MAFQWARGQVTPLAYGKNHVGLVKLSPGQSVVRVLFGIKADGFWTTSGTSTQLDIQVSMSNATAFGLVTTIGNGGETPPDAWTAPQDALPPTQRWLFRAVSSMSFLDMSGNASTWPVGFNSTFESCETEGQVLAPAMSPGLTLNLWLAISTPLGAWSTPTPGDVAWYTAWWSVLTKV